MKSIPQIYEDYLAYCLSIGVKAASWEVWYSHQYSPKANTQ